MSNLSGGTWSRALRTPRAGCIRIYGEAQADLLKGTQGEDWSFHPGCPMDCAHVTYKEMIRKKQIPRTTWDFWIVTGSAGATVARPEYWPPKVPVSVQGRRFSSKGLMSDGNSSSQGHHIQWWTRSNQYDDYINYTMYVQKLLQCSQKFGAHFPTHSSTNWSFKSMHWIRGRKKPSLQEPHESFRSALHCMICSVHCCCLSTRCRTYMMSCTCISSRLENSRVP